MLRKKMKNRVSLSATLSLPLLFFLKRKSDIRMANNRRISIKYPPDGDYPMDSRHRICITQYPGGRYLAIINHPVIRKTFLSVPPPPTLTSSFPSPLGHGLIARNCRRPFKQFCQFRGGPNIYESFKLQYEAYLCIYA